MERERGGVELGCGIECRGYVASRNASTVKPNTDFPSAATIARYGGAVNPAPQGVTLAQWQAAVKSAAAFGPSMKNVGIHYTPLATSSQWYPDPQDVFYNKVRSRL